MTSHTEYIADQDVDQLNHLVEVAKERIDNLTLGGWVQVWVVADIVNQGWFALEEYALAVDFLNKLAKKYLSEERKKELSLELHQYRPVEAQRLIDETLKFKLVASHNES